MNPLSFKSVHCAAIFCATLLAAPLATASETNLTVDELKAIYLDCERGAALGNLSDTEYIACSVIYEDLKQQAFGGNYLELKIWWDAQTEQVAPAGLQMI